MSAVSQSSSELRSVLQVTALLMASQHGLDSAREALLDIVASMMVPTPRITARSVVLAICLEENIPERVMFGDGRHRSVAWPRQRAMFEIHRQCPHMSLPAIGTLFNRDHTTILHGIKVHCERNYIRYDMPRRIVL